MIGGTTLEGVQEQETAFELGERRPVIVRGHERHSRRLGLAGLRWTLLGLALLPPLYLFLAIQYSGLTYPFWDNTDLLRQIAALYDGKLKVSSLWSPHNHSRPLTLRLIYVFNARLTGWDVRSEFIYMYVAIYGTFALHLSILWKLTSRRLALPFAAGALLLSIIYFSPAGHMNHWWSMMLQLNLANLFIVYALWRIARDPTRWMSNIMAAAAGWAATYTLTNGLVVMIVLAILAHAPLARWHVMRWRTLFWIANLVAIFALYLHDLPSEQAGRPTPIELVWFAFVYLGAPLVDLLDFPFHGMFDVPSTTWSQGLVGIVLVLLATVLCVGARRRIRAAEPAALVLLGFSLFALGSALVTGWGRADFDASGVAQANTSRYTIFGSFLLYGLIYYACSMVSRGEWRELLTRPVAFRARIPSGVGAAIAAGIVVGAVAFGAVAYTKGARVYRDAHRWNASLSQAYALTPEARALDRWIYAFPWRSEEIRADLLRLHLGPYRAVQTVDSSAPMDVDVRGARSMVKMAPGTRVYQEFTARRDRLVMISVPIQTVGARSEGVIRWSLFRLRPNGRTRVGGASVSLDQAHTRGTVAIVVGDLGRTAGRRFGLMLEMPTTSAGAVSLPLFDRRGARDVGPAVVDAKSISDLTLRLVESYLHG